MVIFTVECFAKIIAYGLYQHEEAYLRYKILIILILHFVPRKNTTRPSPPPKKKQPFLTSSPPPLKCP